MNAFYLIDALSASFFGLLGIWAAVVRRHWFLRISVVGVLLLSTLLIPAYEVVLMFAIEMVLILAVVWVARGRHAWSRQFSVETALLLMVVVSVTAAVVARIPTLSWGWWAEVVGVGVVSAYAALLGLWIVCGKAPITVRIVVGVLGLVVLVLMRYATEAVIHAANNAQSGQGWLPSLAEYLDAEQLRYWLAGNLPTFAIGVPIVITAIALGRASQWFTLPSESQPARPRRVRLARAGLCTLWLAVALPLGYVLLKLAAAPALPALNFSTPNGYDDFVAAGKLAPPNTIKPNQVGMSASDTPSISDAQLSAEIRLLQPVFDRVALGLSRDCAMDLRLLTARDDAKFRDRAALCSADEALWLRYVQEHRMGTIRARMKSVLDILEFNHKAYRGTGIKWFESSASCQSPDFAVTEVKVWFNKMDGPECRDAARRLTELDRSREPWAEKVRVQRILDEHDEWIIRLRALLSDWSEDHYYKWIRESQERAIAEHRLLIVILGLRAYALEHSGLPRNLKMLVPDFLPALPDDPYGSGVIKMKADDDGVAIYSVFCNGSDDGGVPYPVDAKGRVTKSEGDLVWKYSPADVSLPAPVAPAVKPGSAIPAP